MSISLTGLRTGTLRLSRWSALLGMVLCLLPNQLNAQPPLVVDSLAQRTIQSDTLKSQDSLSRFQQMRPDSLLLIETYSPKDSMSTLELEPYTESSDDALLDPVYSEAKDSICYLIPARHIELHGDVKLKYQQVELESGYIDIDLNERQLYARAKPLSDSIPSQSSPASSDSVKSEISMTKTLGSRLPGSDDASSKDGRPKFKEGSEEYTMDAITYNFDTKKARITGAMTRLEEGYMHGEVIKRYPNEEIHIKGGKFTTCDEDHPHYYIGLTRAKVIPNDKIVTGPAYLVIADVYTPLIIPFAFFPNTKKRASGIIIPSYGEEQQRGFFLRDGGFYLGLNDYFDLTLLGSIYTRGSWEAQIRSTYRLRYKFSGSIQASYSSISSGQRGTPKFSQVNSYRISWMHSQDRASNPNSTFSANVAFGSSSYDRYNARTPDQYLNNQLMSSISYSRQFVGTPFSLSLTLEHTQTTQDSIVNLRIPQVSLSMRRIYPFKWGKRVGKTRWYEKIGLTYSSNLQNSLRIKESKLFTRDALKEMRNGLQQRASLSTSFNLLTYIHASPSINYQENWYLQSFRYHYDPTLKKPVRDTVNGFARSWQFNTSLSFSTKVYGMYQFNEKSRVKAIRHVMTPSVSLSYHPDFAKPIFGMWESVQKDPQGDEMEYSRFQGTIYGGPGKGPSGSIHMSLGNIVEMKIRNRNAKDTTAADVKMPILEMLNFAIAYNILADSLNWSDLSISARTTVLKKLSLNASTQFSLYSEDERGRIYNRYYFRDTHLPLRFKSFSFSASFSANNSFVGPAPDAFTQAYLMGNTRFPMSVNDDYLSLSYVQFKAPWDLSLSYSYSYSKSASNINTYQSLSIRGGFQFADGKWRVTFSTGVDINAMKMTLTSVSIFRDLHCWQMSLNLVPFGTMRSYSFHIAVNSGILRDLKFDKNKSYLDNILR